MKQRIDSELLDKVGKKIPDRTTKLKNTQKKKEEEGFKGATERRET